MLMEDFLNQHKIPFKRHGEHHHSTHGRLQVDCPFCSANSNSFRMGLTNYSAACWSCGPHKLYEALLHLTDKNSVITLINDPEFIKLRDNYHAKDPKPSGKLKLPACRIPLNESRPHRYYLKGRGFNWRKIQAQWGVDAIRHHSKLPWRLFIPITFNGEMVSWTTRTIGDAQLRYVSASAEEEKYNHKQLLYGEEFVGNTVIVVEGPFDVWRIGPGAVATFGTEYSREQVLRLSKYPNRYILFDPEPIAQDRARQLGSELMVFPGKTQNLILDEAEDPADIGPRGIKMLHDLLSG